MKNSKKLKIKKILKFKIEKVDEVLNKIKAEKRMNDALEYEEWKEQQRKKRNNLL